MVINKGINTSIRQIGTITDGFGEGLKNKNLFKDCNYNENDLVIVENKTSNESYLQMIVELLYQLKNSSSSSTISVLNTTIRKELINKIKNISLINKNLINNTNFFLSLNKINYGKTTESTEHIEEAISIIEEIIKKKHINYNSYKREYIKNSYIAIKNSLFKDKIENNKSLLYTNNTRKINIYLPNKNDLFKSKFNFGIYESSYYVSRINKLYDIYRDTNLNKLDSNIYLNKLSTLNFFNSDNLVKESDTYTNLLTYDKLHTENIAKYNKAFKKNISYGSNINIFFNDYLYNKSNFSKNIYRLFYLNKLYKNSYLDKLSAFNNIFNSDNSVKESGSYNTLFSDSIIYTKNTFEYIKAFDNEINLKNNVVNATFDNYLNKNSSIINNYYLRNAYTFFTKKVGFNNAFFNIKDYKIQYNNSPSKYSHLLLGNNIQQLLKTFNNISEFKSISDYSLDYTYLLNSHNKNYNEFNKKDNSFISRLSIFNKYTENTSEFEDNTNYKLKNYNIVNNNGQSEFNNAYKSVVRYEIFKKYNTSILNSYLFNKNIIKYKNNNFEKHNVFNNSDLNYKFIAENKFSQNTYLSELNSFLMVLKNKYKLNYDFYNEKGDYKSIHNNITKDISTYYEDNIINFNNYYGINKFKNKNNELNLINNKYNKQGNLINNKYNKQVNYISNSKYFFDNKNNNTDFYNKNNLIKIIDVINSSKSYKTKKIFKEHINLNSLEYNYYKKVIPLNRFFNTVDLIATTIHKNSVHNNSIIKNKDKLFVNLNKKNGVSETNISVKYVELINRSINEEAIKNVVNNEIRQDRTIVGETKKIVSEYENKMDTKYKYVLKRINDIDSKTEKVISENKFNRENEDNNRTLDDEELFNRVYSRLERTFFSEARRIGR